MPHLHRNGSGPAFVLLHCLGVDHHLWNFAVPHLAHNFEVLTYDFPGHGETPVPDIPYGIEDLSDQLKCLLDQARIKRAHLGGISLGGMVAQHFAAAFPEKVDRLVLIDTTARYTEARRQIWAERASAARSAGVPSLLSDVLPIWFSPEFLAQRPPVVTYVQERFAATPREGYALGCEALAAADLQSLAGMIKARTLVICGENDGPGFLDAARWFAATIPEAHLQWIPGGRHASILEKPLVFLDILQEFLTRV